MNSLETNKVSTKKIAYTGLMMGLCLLATYIIRIPISTTGGYIHLGDGFVLLSGILLGPLYGMLAAGIGSALADVIAGYAAWAVPTLIVKGLMALIVGYVFKNKAKKFINHGLSVGYVIIWSGLMLLVNYLFNNSTEDLSGANGFFDMLIDLKLDASRLTSILIVMAIPLIAVIIYKIVSILKKQEVSLTLNISFVVAGSLMVVLYYITEYILYGSLYMPLIGIPLNIVQFSVGIILCNLILPVTKQINID